MKRYAIEATHTPSRLNTLYPRGYQESYIRRGELVIEAGDFFKDPALWSKYLYTSKKRAEKGMKTLRENTLRVRHWYWDISFKIVEVEID